jgi:hypothetical protein
VQDWAASARLFQRTAAAHSHGPSAYYLGLQLANGQGVPTDYRLAEAALEAAAGSGDARVTDRAGAALFDLRRANVLAEALHAAELREMRAALAASDTATADSDSGWAGGGGGSAWAGGGGESAWSAGDTDSTWVGGSSAAQGGDSTWAGGDSAAQDSGSSAAQVSHHGGNSAAQDRALRGPPTHASTLDDTPADVPGVDDTCVTVEASSGGATVAVAADGTAVDLATANEAAGAANGNGAEGTPRRISAVGEG